MSSALESPQHRPSPDDRKLSPPAFLDLADSVSFVGLTILHFFELRVLIPRFCVTSLQGWAPICLICLLYVSLTSPTPRF